MAQRSSPSAALQGFSGRWLHLGCRHSQHLLQTASRMLLPLRLPYAAGRYGRPRLLRRSPMSGYRPRRIAVRQAPPSRQRSLQNPLLSLLRTIPNPSNQSSREAIGSCLRAARMSCHRLPCRVHLARAAGLSKSCLQAVLGRDSKTDYRLGSWVVHQSRQ